MTETILDSDTNALGPEGIEKSLAEAAAHLRAGRPGEAEVLARRVLNAAPEHPKATYALGLALLAAGRAEAAAGILRTACDQRPDFAQARLNLGSALEASGQGEDAARAYRRALDLNPDMTGAHYKLGGVLQDMGRMDEAAFAYRQALRLRPDFAEAHFNLGGVLYKLGRLEEAEGAYGAALRLRPDMPQAMVNLGSVMVELGRLDQAIALLQRLTGREPDFAGGHSNLGTALREAGRFEEAVAAYRRAVVIEPGFAEAHTNMGGALRALGDLDAAAAAHRRAISLRPDFAEAYVNLGIVLMQGRDFSAALEVCDSFLTREPGNPRVLALKSVVLDELGRRPEVRALVDFDRLIQPVEIAVPSGFETLAAFNEALSAHILSHPTLVFAPTSHATRAGRHTGELLVEPKGPVAALEQAVMAAVEAYIRDRPVDAGHPLLATPPRRWRLTMWSVVMEAQGHQVPHIHPAWLSGCYYAKVPNVVSAQAETHAGWIEFGQPGVQIPYNVEPELKAYQPKEGLVVLFPSYFYHHTVPYEVDEQRISIAFDVLALP